jgi:Rrf2 family transcriptional regulator, nitric oxide-sensitive transcriptional repressor
MLFPAYRPATGQWTDRGAAMRLTKFSDYALRVLIFAASVDAERLVTIEQTAALYGISRAHLKKVVRLLIRDGYLEGLRGRTGGFRLALPPERINLGAVLRSTEPDFSMVECFSTENACRITRQCRLPVLINEALVALVTVFDTHTLADILVDQRHFASVPTLPLPQRGPHLPPLPAAERRR